jgi:serine/threonine-protein kinase
VTETDTGGPPGTESVVVGARCATPGATATTEEGSTAHCANLQYTDRYLWSMVPGEIPNPIVTTSPKVPLPDEDQSPVLICAQQTGHSPERCAQEILRGNAP